MPTLDLSNEQVLQLVRQLPSENMRELLFLLAEEGSKRAAERTAKAEAAARQLASDRGLDWDTMTDEERIAFMDDLIHEDRA